MKLIIVDKNNVTRINKFIDWLIYMVGYALILILVSYLFPTITIDNSYYGLYGLIGAVIIYLLNKTIKPLMFWLTLPITGITLGLFYPCINIVILKITDILLGSHFTTSGIISLFFTAILISIMNLLLEHFILKPLMKRSDV